MHRGRKPSGIIIWPFSDSLLLQIIIVRLKPLMLSFLRKYALLAIFRVFSARSSTNKIQG